MKGWPVLFFVLMQFAIILILFFSGEILFSQIMVISQISILLLLAPFMYREENLFGPVTQTKLAGGIALLIVLALFPFLHNLGTWTVQADWLVSGQTTFSRNREAFLLLGFCSASFFVSGVLMLRRMSS